MLSLLSRLGYRVGIEVGVFKAEYSVKLLKNTNMHLHLVDAWRHLPDYVDPANGTDQECQQVFSQAIQALAPYKGRYTIHRMLSSEAVDHTPEVVDFVYLDADHSHDGCLADLKNYYPKIRKGGIMAGHDYVNNGYHHGAQFGVLSALREFMKDKPFKLHTTGEFWATWYFLKGE
jgi:hypothetical protein